ncbi:chord-domain-containing protein [Clavulina sp. PMI_390]|nr:chord-domain-containing protein [Clavulina sp. PMI_390]
MPKCTRRGCGKSFEADQNEDESCSYHHGAPVFHEGLKSWSCCNEVNKPVLDFDEFMKIQGCTKGKHSDEKPMASALQTSTTPAGPASSTSTPGTSTPQMTGTADAKGKETYSTTSVSQTISNAPSTPAPPAPVVEDEDDVDAPVKPGAKCLRLGCGKAFVSQEESRLGDGEESICVYHPSPPIFREGSKGYLCCKRRVLEFDEFLKIQGCKTGKHVFVKKSQASGGEAEHVKCRIDHYQTPTNVHVSVFAKKVIKEQSKVIFEKDQIHLDLLLPDNKRFVHSLNLFGGITPDECTATFFGTKVELLLVKEDGRSWNVLERPAGDAELPPGYTITFGVGGRTGSVGAKTPVLDGNNDPKP